MMRYAVFFIHGKDVKINKYTVEDTRSILKE